MMRSLIIVLSLAIAFTGCGSLLTMPASACIGKPLLVGSLVNHQQQTPADMLSNLISERAGTTVKVVPVANLADSLEAVLRADLDMYIEYTEIAQIELLIDPRISNFAKRYKAVKERYSQEYNLAWLPPFGSIDARIVPNGTVAEAAPEVCKDTLKKFPALARLVKKLGGKVDLPTMEKLEQERLASSSRDVSRKFFKEYRFI